MQQRAAGKAGSDNPGDRTGAGRVLQRVLNEPVAVAAVVVVAAVVSAAPAPASSPYYHHMQTSPERYWQTQAASMAHNHTHLQPFGSGPCK